MDSHFLVYLWTRLDGVIFICTMAVVFAMFLLTILVWCYADTHYEKEKAQVANRIKQVLMGAAVFGAIAMALPSQKDVLMIYLIPKVAQSPAFGDTKAMLERLPKSVRMYVEKYIAEEKK